LAEILVRHRLDGVAICVGVNGPALLPVEDAKKQSPWRRVHAMDGDLVASNREYQSIPFGRFGWLQKGNKHVPSLAAETGRMPGCGAITTAVAAISESPHALSSTLAISNAPDAASLHFSGK
jgi:hypothetical protein